MKALGACLLLLVSVSNLWATHYSYTNTGGTVSQSSTTLTISGTTLGAPAGTVNLSCTLTQIVPTNFTQEWTCTGGSVSIQSTDGTVSINGVFTGGVFTMVETEVNRVFYYTYNLYAYFSASEKVNGKTIAVAGAITQNLPALTSPLNPTTGTIQTGAIDLDQQWEPVYIADTGNNRIVQTSDILGSNWVSLGKAGSGTNQFSSPWSVAVDSAGKIYVSDSGNCRIVRMDNMLGTNWTSYGTCGSGTGQFSAPKGIWVDAGGHIYVADTGNNRIVRIDDITGTNFTALGGLGNGAGQFNSPAAITTDSAGNIYVADLTNCRIAEFSDMLGTNWATWQFPIPYIGPAGVAVDSTDHIYTTDSYQSQVLRADNISGANEVSVNVNYLIYLNGVEQPWGIFVDGDDAVYIADTNNNRVDRLYAISYNNEIPLGTAGTSVGNLSTPHGVFVVPETKTMAVAAVTPPTLAFPTELVGTASPAETTTLFNIGTASMKVTSVASSLPDFQLTQNCPSSLVAGGSCTASVVFQPTVGGLRKGTAKFTLSGAPSKSVALSGSGALITLSPSQLVLVDGQTGTVTVTNPLSASTSLKSIKIAGKFSQTNNCTTLAPGGSCTITVTYLNNGLVGTGVLYVTDASGTVQYVLLTGE